MDREEQPCTIEKVVGCTKDQPSPSPEAKDGARAVWAPLLPFKVSSSRCKRARRHTKQLHHKTRVPLPLTPGMKTTSFPLSHSPPVFILSRSAKILNFGAVSEGQQDFGAVLLAACAPAVPVSCCWVRFRQLSWNTTQLEPHTNKTHFRIQQQSWAIALSWAYAWANPGESSAHALFLLYYSCYHLNNSLGCFLLIRIFQGLIEYFQTFDSKDSE